MIRKRLAALALSLVLLVGLLSPAVLRASAEGESTIYVRKHVSMLYDDSGSMCSTKVDNNLKWTFASYAAQAFTGLLNDTDSLTITFMNQVGGRADQLTVDLKKDRAEQVSAVKSATGTVVKQGNTPLDRIDAALQVLLDQGLGSAGGQNEQYWLVLLTGTMRSNTSTTSGESSRWTTPTWSTAFPRITSRSGATPCRRAALSRLCAGAVWKGRRNCLPGWRPPACTITAPSSCSSP